MKTVQGPTDRVVIVGAGLAGLSAALRLAGAGREVTVLEREDVPGGRNGLLEVAAPDGAGSYRFDTGPTVLTMPDGSRLDVKADPQAMADEVERVCGPQEARGYLRYVDFVSKLYRYEMKDFIDRNIDSPFDLLTPNLARLVAIGGFRKLAPKVNSYLKDPRTQRVLSFQSMYAGLSPYDALAIYAVIAYMDSVAGVFFPKGGMHAVPRALAGAAEKHGVQLRYGRTVERVLVEHGRAVGVVTTDGERFDADVVVLNPDLPVAYRDLLPPEATPRRVKALDYSPSCYLLLAGSTQSYSQIAHHNIHFGKAWKQVFRELIDDQRLMSDPSVLVTNPTRSDPSLAPDGREIYYVLFPTPDQTSGIDWSVVGPRYREEVVRRLEGLGYVGFGDGIEVEDVTTPADWEARGMAAGAPFAAAHSFFQTGPFRPGNLAPTLENVVFAGSGTQPGVGVPMVLVSGRLAAERILGKDPSYRSRALRLAEPSPVLSGR